VDYTAAGYAYRGYPRNLLVFTAAINKGILRFAFRQTNVVIFYLNGEIIQQHANAKLAELIMHDKTVTDLINLPY
jgi:hypothetical protein